MRHDSSSLACPEAMHYFQLGWNNTIDMWMDNDYLHLRVTESASPTGEPAAIVLRKMCEALQMARAIIQKYEAPPPP